MPDFNPAAVLAEFDARIPANVPEPQRSWELNGLFAATVAELRQTLARERRERLAMARQITGE